MLPVAVAAVAVSALVLLGGGQKVNANVVERWGSTFNQESFTEPASFSEKLSYKTQKIFAMPLYYRLAVLVVVSTAAVCLGGLLYMTITKSKWNESVFQSYMMLNNVPGADAVSRHPRERVELVGSHGRWKRRCLQTAHMAIVSVVDAYNWLGVDAERGCAAPHTVGRRGHTGHARDEQRAVPHRALHLRAAHRYRVRRRQREGGGRAPRKPPGPRAGTLPSGVHTRPYGCRKPSWV
jgi:hypothetical protein